MRVISRGPTKKNVFKEVARLRSRDADLLMANHRALGAVYLLGYSIECYLKFAVCERNEWESLPEKVRLAPGEGDTRLYVHEWPILVEVAGLRWSIAHQSGINAIYSALCEQWGPRLRYRTAPFAGREGSDLYKDQAQLYQFLQELIP